MDKEKMDKRSLVVAIVGVVLSLAVALVSVAFWLGNLKQTVDRLVEESTTGALAVAREAIENAATEALRTSPGCSPRPRCTLPLCVK